VFFEEMCLADRLQATLGPPTCYLPQAYDPHWHCPVTLAGAESCPVMAGNISLSEVKGVNAHTCDVRVTSILEKLS
jgi:hypothetical protein